MSKSWSHALLFASLAGALAGCSSVPDQQRLARPSTDVTYSADLTRSDPVPQAEPPSRSGNPDTYVVFGRRYRVKETSEGHRETGIASWYGWDFHGRKTSSGPPFNMFELTAAHKSLPIPTYARVTNLENGRSIVVKVNDRGPFAGERIIDLSYAAAARLDMLNQGTAQVEVVALEPYQHLPQLAARRAEERERLARR
ncbi:MAG TPA: septal ring lytic transglycosylase RlpA family lipoprotein, partial [Gammaproteobacteria bacterium]|nr:septal ring lytic transglycosylase RlpA family lipoprotein [Gammaproteobacteria bacterium]